jgi:MFS family permease
MNEINDQLSSRSGLSKTQTIRSLESFNWSLGFRAVFDTICGGATFVFVAFALSLGVPKERMGYLTSVVSFACVIQMLSLIFTTRVRSRKKFIVTVALGEPILMIGAVLFVPLLAPALRILALGTAVFVAAASLHLTKPLTDEWLATTIPAGVRGRYLGRRIQIMSVAYVVTMLAAGWVVDWVGKTNTAGLAIVLGFGGCFGILSVVALSHATMPTDTAMARVEWSDIPGTFRCRPFRRYIIGMLLYTVPFFLAVPYYQVFNLEVLGLKPSFVAYMSAGYCVVKIAVMPLMGRMLDRKGARFMMFWAGPTYVLFFLGYALSGPGRVWPAVAAWLLAGLGDAAFSVAMPASLYATVPRGSARPAYFALSNLVLLATYGVGAVAAVPLLEALKSVHVRLGPFVLDQFQCFYGLWTLLMVPCMFGALLLADERRIAAEDR